MEDKVDQQEARAAASGELESTSLEDRFAELETSEQVEHELAELKARKALASAATGSANANVNVREARAGREVARAS